MLLARSCRSRTIRLDAHAAANSFSTSQKAHVFMHAVRIRSGVWDCFGSSVCTESVALGMDVCRTASGLIRLCQSEPEPFFSCVQGKQTHSTPKHLFSASCFGFCKYQEGEAGFRPCLTCDASCTYVQHLLDHVLHVCMYHSTIVSV